MLVKYIRSQDKNAIKNRSAVLMESPKGRNIQIKNQTVNLKLNFSTMESINAPEGSL